ncbi:MAG: hypothetical protein WC346_05050 [Methanogenium sp.]|jgi:hypothetical protein
MAKDVKARLLLLMYVYIVVDLLFCCVGCIDNSVDESDNISTERYTTIYVGNNMVVNDPWIIHDNELNVTIYINSAGISAVPDNELIS